MLHAAQRLCRTRREHYITAFTNAETHAARLELREPRAQSRGVGGAQVLKKAIVVHAQAWFLCWLWANLGLVCGVFIRPSHSCSLGERATASMFIDEKKVSS